MQLTKTPPTVGRIVHAYSNAWSGPRPAIVVQGFGGPHANVNVFFDGANDRKILNERRAHPEGNTYCSVPVYDLDAGQERVSPPSSDEGWKGVAAVDANGFAIFCTWPPVQIAKPAIDPSNN